MWVNKQLFEGGVLGGGLQMEVFIDICFVFIVVGDFQLWVFFVVVVLQGYVVVVQYQCVFQFQCCFQYIVWVNQYSVVFLVVVGGDVVFCIILWVVFKVKVEVVLFVVVVVIFELFLVVVVKVFN